MKENYLTEVLPSLFNQYHSLFSDEAAEMFDVMIGKVLREKFTCTTNADYFVVTNQEGKSYCFGSFEQDDWHDFPKTEFCDSTDEMAAKVVSQMETK
jgi:hypothetical protein